MRSSEAQLGDPTAPDTTDQRGWASRPDGDGRPLRRRTIMPLTATLIASLGMFMAFIDHTVVSIAFPNLLESFPDAGLGSLSWVISAYNVVFAALLVPAGRLADLLGRRRVYLLGIAIFTVASAACAAAPSVESLIAARALQAVGAAIIVPASLALVLHAFGPERRAEGVAIWSASAAVATGLGPSLGGLLVELESWRLVFLVNLPVGVLTWRLATTRLVESRAPGRRAMPDGRGALLLMVAVGTLALGLVQSEDWGWTAPGVIAAFAVAALALALFVRRCMSHRAPIIDPALMRVRSVSVANALTLVGAVGFYALSLSTVIWLMTVWGYSPLQAGLAMTPAPFAGAAAAWLAGRWPTDRDVRPLIFVGALIWCGGAIFLVRHVGTEPNFLGEWLPVAFVLAIGLGLTFPTVSTAAVAGGSDDRFATATAINSTIRQLGAALGVALFVVLLGQPGADQVASAFDRVWTVSAALFAAVAFGSLALGRLVLASPARAATETRPPGARGERRPPRHRGQALRAAAEATEETPADILAEVPIFAELEPEARAAIAAKVQTRTVLAGSWLFRQGDPGDALHVVRSGRLEVVHEHDEQAPKVILELSRGAVLGELALISGSTRSASVRARRDSELLSLERDEFEQLLADQPDFARQVLAHVARMLEASRPIAPPGSRAPATIAVVPIGPAAPAELLGRQLEGELRRLGSVARLDRSTFGELRGGGAAAELARLLERCEREQGRVLLVASEPPGADEWTAACLRQADRVLAVVGDAPAASLDHDAVRGCEVLICGRPPDDELTALLDRIEPRRVHRVRIDRSGSGVAAVARRLAGRSVGLVLSGGGARALAHVGVIEELQASGVTVDRIAGTSMGAFVGAMAALGMDAEEIDARCYEEWVRRRPLSDYRLPRTSLIRGERVRAMLERNLPGAIEQLELPFWCVSTDIISGELVVHRRGELATAIGASMCLPVLAPPVVSGERLLVDGGVLDNLPVGLMAEEGEGPIIASKANDSEAYAHDGDAPLGPPPLTETLYRLILLGASDTVELARRHADVLITPDYEGTGMLEFYMLDTLREAGRRAAAEALAQAPPEVFG